MGEGAGGEEPEGEEPAVTDEAGKALDTLTDVVEEKEVTNSQTAQEASRSSVAQLLREDEERSAAVRAREKELAAVKIGCPADIETVAAELDLDVKAAERRLREHGGDLLATLRAAVL